MVGEGFELNSVVDLLARSEASEIHPSSKVGSLECGWTRDSLFIAECFGRCVLDDHSCRPVTACPDDRAGFGDISALHSAGDDWSRLCRCDDLWKAAIPWKEQSASCSYRTREETSSMHTHLSVFDQYGAYRARAALDIRRACLAEHFSNSNVN